MRNRARIMYHVARNDVLSLGWWLRRSLSAEHRRRLGLIILRDEPLTLRFEADGLTWEVPVGDEVTRTLFASGGFSVEAVDLLHAMFGAGTLLEIGANVGTTTLPFARHGWKVIAVEPVPELHAMLVDNVARNDFGSSVECVDAAIASEAGRGTMVLPVGMYGSSYVEGRGYIGGGGAQVEVDTLTIEDVVRDRDVTLVWCDAEGSEGIVIEAGAPLWRRGVPLYVELAPEHVDVAREHFSTFRLPLDAAPRPTTELTAVVDRVVDVLLECAGPPSSTTSNVE